MSDKKLTAEQMVIELLRVLYPEKVVMAETIVFAFGPRELKPEPPSLEQEIANVIAECLGITSPDITERIMALISRHSEVKK